MIDIKSNNNRDYTILWSFLFKKDNHDKEKPIKKSILTRKSVNNYLIKCRRIKDRIVTGV